MGAAAECKGQGTPWYLGKEKDTITLWDGASLRPGEI